MAEENLEQGMFAGFKAFVVVRTAMGPYKFESSSCKKKTCGCVILSFICACNSTGHMHSSDFI